MIILGIKLYQNYKLKSLNFLFIKNNTNLNSDHLKNYHQKKLY